MLKFIIGLIILLVMLVGLIVHVREKKSLSEVLVWIIGSTWIEKGITEGS